MDAEEFLLHLVGDGKIIPGSHIPTPVPSTLNDYLIFMSYIPEHWDVKSILSKTELTYEEEKIKELLEKESKLKVLFEKAVKNENLSLKKFSNSATDIFVCSIESLYRNVTISFSTVSSSILIAYGVPMASPLLYLLPILPESS